ncbi:hypothetical protein sos41_12490 [Alphaproteobacteria bacterium SO-S41]|nr:hypothetical protein sos41_12490 [Alphaproteobacteria bacterium SO-S41]
MSPEKTPEKATKRTSREAILDAAEALVREQGVNRMTLDAVAARAGLSKGGLLYNFPSKDSLLRGMIERFAARFNEPGEGSAAGRMIDIRLEALAEKAQHRQAGHGMLAAIAEKPELLDPMRVAQASLWRTIKETDAAPDRSLIAWLAAEGLGFLEMFDISPLNDEERARIAAAIRAMAEG